MTQERIIIELNKEIENIFIENSINLFDLLKKYKIVFEIASKTNFSFKSIDIFPNIAINVVDNDLPSEINSIKLLIENIINREIIVKDNKFNELDLSKITINDISNNQNIKDITIYFTIKGKIYEK